jgi:hypothetical protein
MEDIPMQFHYSTEKKSSEVLKTSDD